MQKLSRLALPLVVLTVSVTAAFFLLTTAPKPERKPSRLILPSVEVMEVRPADYQVKVSTNGTVTPRTQSALVSEVAGRIVEVSSNFRNGGFFGHNEVLAVIDEAEYQLAADDIEAALEGVEARLAELETTAANLQKSLAIEAQHLELAQRQFQRNSRLREQGTVAQSLLEQSEREFLASKAAVQELNNKLALIPAQRRVLQAELKLKQAQLGTARLDLQRTKIRTPYAGRVLEKQVDIGQSVAKGTVLATIYAVDHAEIRLPVTDLEAAFLELPNGRSDEAAAKALSAVTLMADIGGLRHEWQGRIVRTEGAIDARTRQLFLIAQMDDPYVASNGRPPLKVGQFMEAEIPGRILHDVFVLPRKAVRADAEVLVVTPEDRIERRRLEVVWGDRESVVATAGLQSGERISLTALPYAPEGSQVVVAGDERRQGEAQRLTGAN